MQLFQSVGFQKNLANLPSQTVSTDSAKVKGHAAHIINQAIKLIKQEF